MPVKDILSPGSCFEDRFVEDYDRLAQIAVDLKRLGYRLVLTQGVYDLIHRGHITYLEEAKKRGDVLVVGVDSDALARSRKGPTRPIVPLDERLRVLVSLRSVDVVTVINGYGEGHRDIVEVVKPDVLIVSETTTDIAPERMAFFNEHCGRVEKLPPQAQVSTTGRIRDIMADGAVEHLKKLHEGLGEMIAALAVREGVGNGSN